MVYLRHVFHTVKTREAIVPRSDEGEDESLTASPSSQSFFAGPSQSTAPSVPPPTRISQQQQPGFVTMGHPVSEAQSEPLKVDGVLLDDAPDGGVDAQQSKRRDSQQSKRRDSQQSSLQQSEQPLDNSSNESAEAAEQTPDKPEEPSSSPPSTPVPAVQLGNASVGDTE
eukprot:TRINITY_DN11169_c0_g1_i7.p2 TRINITY_DN11169_c0_g1~~TRINITY_DN11169_c0_g1_i7.p2  ORF type:complete len:169 (+),score=32.44 TRINITY_DN11169_c0_g1_i7:1819-2325(+)